MNEKNPLSVNIIGFFLIMSGSYALVNAGAGLLGVDALRGLLEDNLMDYLIVLGLFAMVFALLPFLVDKLRNQFKAWYAALVLVIIQTLVPFLSYKAEYLQLAEGSTQILNTVGLIGALTFGIVGLFVGISLLSTKKWSWFVTTIVSSLALLSIPSIFSKPIILVSIAMQVGFVWKLVQHRKLFGI
jgi:hypothetical protein